MAPTMIRGALYTRTHPENITDETFGQHLFRRTKSDNFPCMHDSKIITKHGGKVQIMQRNDTGYRKP
ncbi:hypothetical protein D3C72_1938700 [compost metagenome]